MVINEKVLPINTRFSKAYPRMSFHISIKGDTEMNYRIEEKEGLEMFGVSTKIHSEDGKPFTEIQEFWGKCINNEHADGPEFEMTY